MGMTKTREWECDLCGDKENTGDKYPPTSFLEIKRTVGFPKPKKLVVCTRCVSAVKDVRERESIWIDVKY